MFEKNLVFRVGWPGRGCYRQAATGCHLNFGGRGSPFLFAVSPRFSKFIPRPSLVPDSPNLFPASPRFSNFIPLFSLVLPGYSWLSSILLHSSSDSNFIPRFSNFIPWFSPVLQLYSPVLPSFLFYSPVLQSPALFPGSPWFPRSRQFSLLFPGSTWFSWVLSFQRLSNVFLI